MPARFAAWLFIAIGGLASWPARPVVGQEVALAARSPRFLYVPSASARPVEIDVKRTAALRQVVSLQVERPTVGLLLAAIEQQTGLAFAYDNDFQADRRVTLWADSITVASALAGMLYDAGVDVVLSRGGHVALVKRPPAPPTGAIVGRVTNAQSGEAIEGAEVYLQGTQWRTLTAADGQYRLADVDTGTYVITARRIGYTKQSRSVAVVEGQEATADFALQAAVTKLEELVTTGTHIRGGKSPASPVQVYTLDEIDRTGLGSVQEFVQRIPANFKGGASEGTVGNVAGGRPVDNSVGGTGVNLRGLGNDATLVLINGRRVAPGNTRGNFVDVSLIPLAALVRTEVVPDGASAIYGSDAVGGVINFILRRDFQGAETRARYGLATEADPHEFQVGQTLGHAWSNGSALLSYEYFDRTPVDASDRSYAGPVGAPFDLLPKQQRHGAFLHIDQAVGPRFGLFADGTYSHRSTSDVFSSPPFSFLADGHADVGAYNAAFGGRAQLSDRFGLELSSSYGESDTHRRVFNAAGTLSSHLQVGTSIWSVDTKLDGPLWTLPAGPVQFAIGGQYRKERFDSEDLRFGNRFQPRRDLLAGFLELQVPLVGPGSRARSANQLELTMAARSERYSDFGWSHNPHGGISWRPLTALKLRGTYGTSFKAPLLNDLNPVPFQVVALPQFDPLIGRDTFVLIPFGGSPDLQPEKATTWTLGMDLFPEGLPGLRASATYYNIRFRDRIADAQGSGFDVFDALRIESVLGPVVVQRDPPLSLVQELAASPNYGDFTGIPGGVDLEAIAAIIDSRKHNLSEVTTSGIDVGLSYTTRTALGKLEAGVDGTYILKFDNQVTSTAPVVEILNTPYNPVDLKLRARGILQPGNFTVAGFINYTDSYTDNRFGGSVPVKSWTTGDVSFGYKFRASSGLLGGVSALLSVINITNADPPFVASEHPFFPTINFDGANANLLGRFYSLQVSKRW